jgi:hypothetical protein
VANSSLLWPTHDKLTRPDFREVPAGTGVYQEQWYATMARGRVVSIHEACVYLPQRYGWVCSAKGVAWTQRMIPVQDCNIWRNSGWLSQKLLHPKYRAKVIFSEVDIPLASTENAEAKNNCYDKSNIQNIYLVKWLSLAMLSNLSYGDKVNLKGNVSF